MWDLPGPGIEPVSPALAGGFLTTAPPGKSLGVNEVFVALHETQKNSFEIYMYFRGQQKSSGLTSSHTIDKLILAYLFTKKNARFVKWKRAGWCNRLATCSFDHIDFFSSYSFYSGSKKCPGLSDRGHGSASR